MFQNPFFQAPLDYSGREVLITQILDQYNKQPTKKPSSWDENIHTSIVYDSKNNIDYFEKAGIPLDLVSEINDLVQQFIAKNDLSDIGTFYIAEMWYNVYTNRQYQNMHKHSNGSNMFFSGVYFMKYNEEEHSATRFYNPHFEIDFEKVQDNSFFVQTPNIKEKDVFIFPSDVGHDVLPQNSADPRITIAFNVACIMKEKFEYA